MKNNTKTIALIACAVAVLGSFMPWATLQALFIKVDVNGMAVDGQWTIAFALLAGLTCYFGKRLWLGTVGCLLGFATSVVDISRILNQIESGRQDGVTGSVGMGLYLCTAGFIVTFFMIRSLRNTAKAAAVVEPATWAAPQSI